MIQTDLDKLHRVEALAAQLCDAVMETDPHQRLGCALSAAATLVEYASIEFERSDDHGAAASLVQIADGFRKLSKENYDQRRRRPLN